VLAGADCWCWLLDDGVLVLAFQLLVLASLLLLLLSLLLLLLLLLLLGTGWWVLCDGAGDVASAAAGAAQSPVPADIVLGAYTLGCPRQV
jgi:hypothetical protein